MRTTKFSISRSIGAVAFLLLSTGLSGCVGLAVGAGATAGTAAMQDRGLGGVIDDTVIHGKVTSAYFAYDVKFKLITAKVHEGRVLLTGTVPKPEDRVRISGFQPALPNDGHRQRRTAVAATADVAT